MRALNHCSSRASVATTPARVPCRRPPALAPSALTARLASNSSASTSSSGRAVPSATTSSTWRRHSTATAAAAQDTAPASAAAAPTQPVDYFATDKRPIILFDGVCNLCNGGVNFMLDWDTQGAYRLAALQSNAGRQLLVRCGRAPDDISSIVLVEEQQHYTKSDAILRIATRLVLPLPLVAAALMPLPYFVRDTVYDQIANNRYSFFGKTNTCRLSASGFKDRFLEA